MNKKETKLKNAYIWDNKPLQECSTEWAEPNISSQLRILCINLATMFGDTNLNQTFVVCGNKKCYVRIEIEETEE